MRPDEPRLVLVMVGLPARGKTYIARKLARYLNWLGYSAQVFNVGNYRRARLGPQQPASFFDPSNPEGARARAEMARAALDDCVAWLRSGGQVAIYDATNVTRERRELVRELLEEHGLQPVFIESICDDPAVIESNIRETKLRSPDYVGADPDEAVADFRARIAYYERAYEPVEDDFAYVKLVDVGRKVVVHRIHGYLLSRLVYLLMNLHVTPRTLWLVRHGESAFNPEGRIGGDPPLTPRGQRFARRLSDFLTSQAVEPPLVYTSTLRRTIQTASALPWPHHPWRALNEIEAGACDGMTYAQIAREHPEEYEARAADKLRYRYPRGESYEDVIQRLDPVLIELERQQRPVLVIAHNAVLRALYGYFADVPLERCPHLDIPLHTLIELAPKAYGVAERRHLLDDPPDSA